MAGDLKFRIDTAISEQMRDGIATICQINIISQSVYLRQLIVKDLIEQGIIERPKIKRFNNSIPQEINGAHDATEAP
jgi:hypothetical protein